MPIPTVKTVKEPNYLKKSYLFYGSPKIGKTTITAQFGDDVNKVLFFATEPGHKHQEIFKWYVSEPVTQTNPNGVQETINVDRDPSNWEHFKQAVMEMSAQNDFKMLAVDTADNLFDWCQRYCRKKYSIEHESDMKFGKGYDILKKEFGGPINYLAQKGFGVVFLSHDKTDDREVGRRTIRVTDTTLPNTAKKIIHPLVDSILYFHADENGNRVIRCKGTENVNAGDRSGLLPEILPMDAKVLIKALKGEK